MIERIRKGVISLLAVSLALFTLWEVNYATIPPLAQLAVFAMLGTVLCFLFFPIHKKLENNVPLRIVDFVLAIAVTACCCYLIWQGNALTNDRVGRFTATDHLVAVVGTLLMLEATRRSVGTALPILAGVFLLYAFFGASLPDWAYPHKGYDVNRVAETCFLGSSGVFGIAMGVMFTYVFLFVVFGVFLELSGATQYIIDFAKRLFGRFSGGPAMVSVAGAGLMGSLSGSAVANAVTTGAFTIPMMTSSGFRPKDAGGITAAAAAGGALMPPVMGAGAYMMLEIIDPPVTYLQIVKAALIPALLYYLSLLLIVYFYSRRVGTQAGKDEERPRLLQYSGLVFFGALGTLILFLLVGFTPFRAVTYSLQVILVLSIVNPKIEASVASRVIGLATFGLVTAIVAIARSRVDVQLSLADWTTWAAAAIPGMLVTMLAAYAHPVWRPKVHEAFVKAARGGIALVAASACVGIIMGVVTLTGVGTEFPNSVVPLAEESLLAALLAIMVCSIVLGMGLPSAVCYLLMATLIGPVLSELGVVPLAAHLFIFYFGMMSMVTPPVALAAYASASIAKAKIMPTAIASFFFALVGFTLPFMFVFRPELLLLSDKPELAVITAKPVDEQAGDVQVTVALDFVKKPVTNVEVQFSRAEDASPVTARTNSLGRATIDLPDGDWRISSREKKRDRLRLGDGDLIELEEGHWLEAKDGRRIDVQPGQTRGDLFEDDVYVAWDGTTLVLGTLSVSAARVKTASEADAGEEEVVPFVDQRLSPRAVLLAVGAAVLGIIALAAAIAGFLAAPLSAVSRSLMVCAAALLLLPEIEIAGREIGFYVNITGAVVFGIMAVVNATGERRASPRLDE